MTLREVARKFKLTIVAESNILDTPVDYPNSDDVKLGVYLDAVAEVHGWQFERTKDKKVFKIKSPDLAKRAMIPVSTLSKKSLERFRELGHEIVRFNNILYVRAPQGMHFPDVAQPIPLVFTVTVNTFDQNLLKDSGININALAQFQSRYVNLFSSYNPATSLLALQKNGLTGGLGINYEKLSASVDSSFTLNLDGTNISPTLWKEENTRTLLIENRNVTDARVAVDRETITGGRSLRIEPLGNNIYRIKFTDLDIADNNDLTGLTYEADISLVNRNAKLVLQSTDKTKSRRWLGKKKQIRSRYYVLTINVTHASKAKRARKKYYSPSLVFPYIKRKKFLGMPIGKKILSYK